MVRRPVIVTDRAIVAEEKVPIVRVLLGWIMTDSPVPQMMMRIDDRRREGTGR